MTGKDVRFIALLGVTVFSLHEIFPKLRRSPAFQTVNVFIDQRPWLSCTEIHVHFWQQSWIVIEEPNRNRDEISRNLCHRDSRTTVPTKSPVDPWGRLKESNAVLAPQPAECVPKDLELGHKASSRVPLAALAIAITEKNYPVRF